MNLPDGLTLVGVGTFLLATQAAWHHWRLSRLEDHIGWLAPLERRVSSLERQMEQLLKSLEDRLK